MEGKEGRKTVLVAGGAGFIGSHLCERLCRTCLVVCLDNFYTGSRENLKGLENLVVVEADVASPDLFLRLRDFAFYEIYNLACPASPEKYQKDPVFTWKTSVLGTLGLLELAKYHGATFLQASTSEVYGEPLEHPQKESLWTHLNPVGIRSCYDMGKAAAETLITDFGKKYSVKTRIVRIFNCYGPRMALDDGRVVSNFIAQALSGKDITVYGEGKQTRSFCYVSDLVEGLVRAMECEKLTGPVNLGNPGEFTVLELATKIIELTESKSEVVYKEMPKDDPSRRKPDIFLAKEVLGWEPTVPLEEGLKATIKDFRKRLSTSDETDPIHYVTTGMGKACSAIAVAELFKKL